MSTWDIAGRKMGGNMMRADSEARFTVLLARVDAFVATTVSCLSNDGSDKPGGHGQTLYLDTFVFSLPIASDQLV